MKYLLLAACGSAGLGTAAVEWEKRRTVCASPGNTQNQRMGKARDCGNKES